MTFSRPENVDARGHSASDQRVAGSDPESNHPERSQFRDNQPGSMETATPLETETLLEAPKLTYAASLNRSVSSASGTLPEPLNPVPSPPIAQPSQPIPSTESSIQPSIQPAPTSVVAEQKIALLEERLVIGQRRQKVGEVIFRKEIETRIVEVPVRREKLIVEQISPEYKQLAVVDLGQKGTDVDAIETTDVARLPTLRGEFSSVKSAIQFLEAIAAHSGADSQRVELGVILQDAAMQATAQSWLEQYAAQKASTASS